MHVTLRRGQVLVSGELLNRSRRRATHGQMRTERVPQNVDPRFHVCASRRSPHRDLNHFLRERLSATVAEHARSAQMSRVSQCSLQPFRQGHMSQPPAFRHRYMSLLLRTCHTEVPFIQVEVGPLERHDFAASQARLAAE